jgi:general secretion pathway protein G
MSLIASSLYRKNPPMWRLPLVPGLTTLTTRKARGIRSACFLNRVQISTRKQLAAFQSLTPMALGNPQRRFSRSLCSVEAFDSVLEADASRTRASGAIGRSFNISRRPAFTLVEIMIVVAIIGTLASIAIPAVTRALYRSQVIRAVSDIRTLQVDIDLFELENARVPEDLAELGRTPLNDPWGHPYVYMSFAAVGPSWKGKARKDHSLVPLNSTYDLYSVGKDGKSSSPLTAKASDDDILRANDGGFIGRASDF